MASSVKRRSEDGIAHTINLGSDTTEGARSLCIQMKKQIRINTAFFRREFAFTETVMDETLRKTWPRRSSMTNNFDPSSSSGDNHIRVRAFRNADRARLQLVVTLTKDDQKQLTNKSRLDKSRALTASFGTRRSKIEVTKLESRHLKEENLPSNQTADRLINDANKQGNIITQREVMDNTNASIVRNIPPYDLNAMTLEDVYLLEKSF